MKDFIAIDFETANECPSSVCSIGAVLVRNGEIARSFYSLIRPEPEYYKWFCQKVHGITQEDTEDAPVFPHVWHRMMHTLLGEPGGRDAELMSEDTICAGQEAGNRTATGNGPITGNISANGNRPATGKGTAGTVATGRERAAKGTADVPAHQTGGTSSKCLLPLVAHNSRFDENCLRSVFNVYRMDYPGFVFHDTLKASRNHFGRCLPDHRLPTVSAACGFDLSLHHHALADAEACAHIAIRIL